MRTLSTIFNGFSIKLHTVSLILLSALLFSSCSSLLDKNESYNIGYKNGYLKGLEDGQAQHQKKSSQPVDVPTVSSKPTQSTNTTNLNEDQINPATNIDVPQKAIVVLNYIRKNNKAPDGYVGGRHFGNYEHNLPDRDAAGNKMDYQEWDIQPKVDGKNRGAQRLITSSDGRAWYTADHYNSFTEIK